MYYESCLYVDKNQNSLINQFQESIYKDIITRKKDILLIYGIEEIINWIKKKKIQNLILPYETVGNNIFNNNLFLKKINALKINYKFYLREWDRYSFPYTKKGFFPFKKKIPELLRLGGLLDYKS